jgi:hypothetical protein
VVLDAATGRRIRAYPAAPFGGAVYASTASTVIVGTHAVTSYLNRTGRVAWSRSTGPVGQAWQVDGDRLYVTVAAGGYLGTAPVTALRQISLRTGVMRLVRPPGHAFAGLLSLAFGGAVYFTHGGGITAYDAGTGTRLWRRPDVQLEGVDVPQQRLYLLAGSSLTGVDPWTGVRQGSAPVVSAAQAAGMSGVQNGVALQVSPGPAGKAWGYDAARQRVAWTSQPLPYPHYFVDLSGLGGSTSPGLGGLLLASCAQLGPAPSATGATGAAGAGQAAGQPCARPELVLLNR